MADTASDGRGLGTGLMLLIGGAAFVLTMAGLREIGNIIGPVFLALTLAITVRPVTHWFAERGAPGWVGTVAVLLILYIVLLGMVFVLGASIAQLATTLPDYSDRFTELYQQVLAQLGRLGVSEGALANVQDQFNFGSILGLVQTLLGQLQSVTTGLLFVLLSLAFLVLDTADLSARTQRLREARPHLVAAIEDFSWRVRRYWLFSAIFGLILAVADWLALLLLDIPFPLTWAVVAFICNFIPNIGFVVAVIPPALLALLTQGPRAALLVLAAYVLISFVVQTLLLPKFMGDAVGGHRPDRPRDPAHPLRQGPRHRLDTPAELAREPAVDRGRGPERAGQTRSPIRTAPTTSATQRRPRSLTRTLSIACTASPWTRSVTSTPASRRACA